MTPSKSKLRPCVVHFSESCASHTPLEAEAVAMAENLMDVMMNAAAA